MGKVRNIGDGLTDLYHVRPQQIQAMEHSLTYVPPHMRSAIIRWIEEAHPHGDFLRAFLQNDLKRAFMYAGDENFRAMGTISTWFCNYAPVDCYGSVDKYFAWKGLQHYKQKENKNE